MLSKIAEISHLLPHSLVWSDVSTCDMFMCFWFGLAYVFGLVWYVYLCLVWSGICDWASQSVCLSVHVPAPAPQCVLECAMSVI